MSFLRRREGPISVVAIVIILILVDYYVDIGVVNTLGTEIRGWSVILSAFLVFVGIFNMLVFSYHRIRQRRTDYWVEVLVWIAFWVSAAFGLYPPFGTHKSYEFIVTQITNPATNAAFGMTGIYIISGAYRGFRLRNWEIVILMIPTVLVALSNAPFTGLISPQLVAAGSWLFNYPMSAFFRATTIGAAFGMVALTIRTMIGRERGLMPES